MLNEEVIWQASDSPLSKELQNCSQLLRCVQLKSWLCIGYVNFVCNLTLHYVVQLYLIRLLPVLPILGCTLHLKTYSIVNTTRSRAWLMFQIVINYSEDANSSFVALLPLAPNIVFSSGRLQLWQWWWWVFLFAAHGWRINTPWLIYFWNKTLVNKVSHPTAHLHYLIWNKLTTCFIKIPCMLVHNWAQTILPTYMPYCTYF